MRPLNAIRTQISASIIAAYFFGFPVDISSPLIKIAGIALYLPFMWRGDLVGARPPGHSANVQALNLKSQPINANTTSSVSASLVHTVRNPKP